MMMSFLRTVKLIDQITYHKNILLQAYPQKNPKKRKQFAKGLSKRMSSFSFSCAEGSMTVEASLAIPVFLFVCINLLWILSVFGEYSSALFKLQQQTKEMAVYAHTIQSDDNGQNDLIIRKKVLKVTPPFPSVGFLNAEIVVNCRARKWTGYDVLHAKTPDLEEEWVYITPFGTAYHRRRDCTYLNLSLHCVGISEIEKMRNQDMERYLPCERCSKAGYSGIVFYTEQGNRYHSSLLCSSLKRTVSRIRLTQAGSRHACSRCGHTGET